MKKRILCAVLCLFAFIALAGCSGNSTDDSLKYIKDKGTFVLGLDDAFPPMGFRDENDKIVGFDIDMAEEVTKRMGLELVIQPIDWDSKEFELNNKNIDVIWNGFTITDKRKETVLFSDPYISSYQLIVVKKDSDIITKADVYGKTVALQDGSSAMDALEKDTELNDSIKEKIDYPDNVKALMDLSSGRIDAVIIDEVVGRYYVGLKPDEYRILDDMLTPEDYAIGFRLDDKSFRDEVQKQLDAMKSDGTSATISEKWFGKDIVK